MEFSIFIKYGHDAFDIESDYIRCTIPFDVEVISKTKNKNVGLNVGLNKTEKKVIRYLLDDESYSAEEVAKKVDVTKRTIERAFSSLQNKGLIERIGSKRDGVWHVIK